MSEIIQGIKVIKMYAWENSFAKLIEEARKAEINVVQKSCLYKAFNMCFFFTSSRWFSVGICKYKPGYK